MARVCLRRGSGDFKVNGRTFEQYFVTPSQRSSAKQCLVSTESAATFNVIANVSGGGVNGQADAVKLGIARALMQFNAELRKKLKAEGLVSRDSRSKERKKDGQKGARKRFQFSKRKFATGTRPRLHWRFVGYLSCPLPAGKFGMQGFRFGFS